MINETLGVAPFPSVIVIPCTTDLKGNQFRFHLIRLGVLQKPSELILQRVCPLDLEHFPVRRTFETFLPKQMREIRKRLNFIFGYLG